MSGLRDLQCAVGRAVLGHDEAGIVDAILGDGLDPARRVGIYRHHYLTSLTEALKSIYPVVERLVGEGFFAYAADAFIAASPPREACLFEYGEGFPDFLAKFPPAAGLAYLPDVARLEWAINASLHSPDGPPADHAAFARLSVEDYPRLVFRLQPSLRLLASAWRVDRIWQANRPDKPEADAVDLAEGGCALEIRQKADSVVFRRLDAEEFAFCAALAEGRSLEAAAAAMLERNPVFDLAEALRRLLGEGLVTGFDLASPPTRP
jgi:hypothetical protein